MMNVINKYYTNARLDANGDILVDRVTDYYATEGKRTQRDRYNRYGYAR